MPRLRKLHRIASQVGQDLAYAPGIANKGPGQVGLHTHGHVQAFVVGTRRQQRRHIPHHIGQLERLDVQRQLASGGLREVQDVIDDRKKGISPFINRIDIVCLPRIKV